MRLSLLILLLVFVLEIDYCSAKKSRSSQSSSSSSSSPSSSNSELLLAKEIERGGAIGSACPIHNQHEQVLLSVSLELMPSSLSAARDCIMTALTRNPNVGGLWTALANITGIEQYYSHATALNGAFTEQFEAFRLLGPFTIGKNEMDGDPVEANGGIRAQKWWKYEQYPSELLENGVTSWSHITTKNNIAEVSFPVDWNRLIQSTSSMTILEFQGWAESHFFINSEGSYAVACSGVVAFEIDHHLQHLVGDIYWSGMIWNRIFLERGVHTIYIKLKGKAQMRFSCQIQSAAADDNTRVKTKKNRLGLVVQAALAVPDVVDGQFFGGEGLVAIPVVNMDSKIMQNPVVTIAKTVGAEMGIVLSSTQPQNTPIVPGQTGIIVISLTTRNTTPVSIRDCTHSLNIAISAPGFDASHVTIPIRCRTRKNQSFVFTFKDHDGAIGEAAAVEPMGSCSKPPCGILLTLHGTGVSANNQADAYKQQRRNGDWIFGVKDLWVLAPTRHGAHNWEQTGFLTAVSAANSLFHRAPKGEVSRGDIIFAGHSMGGHGAWHLATHIPDFGLGVASVAGWIRKEYYGDSNVFFDHDVGTCHTDPRLKAILEASFAENNNDMLAYNLVNLPVLARIGDRDANVPPWQQRRMVRILKEAGVNATYVELKGKEHWWWDSEKSSDGGCVNDEQMRTFFANVLAIKRKVPAEFTVAVVNPGSHYGKGGVPILQQIRPFQLSTIVVKRNDASEWDMTTRNVRRFKVNKKHGDDDDDDVQAFVIDHQRFSCASASCEFVRHSNDGGKWEHFNNNNNNINNNLERTPATSGPARQVTEVPFAIIKGNSSLWMDHAALFIANLFFSAAYTPTEIHDGNSMIPSGKNLIILGLTKSMQILTPVSIAHDSITVGPCVFKGSNIGILFTTPLTTKQSFDNNDNDDNELWNHNSSRSGRMALIIAGTDEEGMSYALNVARPTIPPMVRSPFANQVPDFMVLDKQVKHKGTGGILAAGFWNSSWKVDLQDAFIANPAVCM